MFGIKTKKDKRIEELETQLSSIYFKQPRIITTHGNVIVLGAGQVLEIGMSPEYAKRMIAQKLIDEAINYITYDLEDYCGKMMFKGYIRIVTYGADKGNA